MQMKTLASFFFKENNGDSQNEISFLVVLLTHNS
jgi:hypothetical protein